MKAKQLNGWLSACCLAGSWAPLRAIEAPAPVEPPKVEIQVEGTGGGAAAGAAAGGQEEAGPAERPGAKPEAAADAKAAPEAGKQGYLGLGGAEIPALLAEHLGLEGGVVVETLDPDGPAVKAGIAQNDVITKVGGKAVTSLEELREAVAGHKAGEEVAVESIHRGKVATKTLALGERPAVADAAGGDEWGNMLQGLPEEQAKRVREAIEQNLKALQGQGQAVPGDGGGGAGGALGMPDALKQLQQGLGNAMRGMRQFKLVPGDGNMQLNMQSSSSIRLMDDHGSVEMEMKDGGKEVRVRDKEGKVQWEGPYDTAQDKAAVPDEVRERIDKMNFDVIEGGPQGGGLRMRIGPRGVEPQQPAAPKEEKKDEDKEDVKPAPEPDVKPAE